MALGQLIEVCTPSLSGGGTYGLHTTILSSGWSAYVANVVQGGSNNTLQDCFDWGTRRLMVHLPHGQETGQDYRFDIFYDAKHAGLSNAVSLSGFIDAFSPFIENGGELIVYFGKAKGTARMTRNKTSARAQQYFRLWNTVLSFSLVTGASVAIDASSELLSTDPEYHLFEALRQLEVPCYIETWSNQSHLLAFRQIIVESFYQAQLGQSWMPTLNDDPGELVRWAQTFGSWTAGAVSSSALSIAGDGHTAMVPAGWVMDSGYSYGDFG